MPKQKEQELEIRNSKSKCHSKTGIQPVYQIRNHC